MIAGDLRAGERCDELTEVWLELREEIVAAIEEWKEEHYIPFGMVERTETAQERTHLLVDRIGEEVVRQALGW